MYLSITFSTSTFDVDKMKEASKLFLGLHDFRTFMGKGTHHLNKVTRRVLDRLDVCEASPTFYSQYSWPVLSTPINNNVEYKFFDVYVQARGFLYNQVSIYVCSLIAISANLKIVQDINVRCHH